MRFTVQTTLLAVIVTAIGATQSQATFIKYSTQASYLAAISNPGVDTYDTLGGGVVGSTVLTPTNRTAGTYSYTVSILDPGSNQDSIVTSGSGTDIWLSPNATRDSITLSNFSAGVRGVGGFFFASDTNGAFLPGKSITLSATDGSGTVTETLTNATQTTFFGFVSDGPITSLVITTPSTGDVWQSVNNLTLGEAPSTNAVPAPAGLLLGLTGLPIFGLVARQRRRTTAQA